MSCRSRLGILELEAGCLAELMGAPIERQEPVHGLAVSRIKLRDTQRHSRP